MTSPPHDGHAIDQTIGRRMTSAEFADNLSRLHDGDDFPQDLLKALYASIKGCALPWAM